MEFKNLGKVSSLKTIKIKDNNYQIYSLKSLYKEYPSLKQIPFSLKVLLENLLRKFDGSKITDKDIEYLASWTKGTNVKHEISYYPARILMQDFTGVPAVVDLAAMRDAVKDKNLDPNIINPNNLVDLVIDHSLMVDNYATSESFDDNVKLEYKRNKERYSFLKWGQQAFKGLRVVPPGTGICHQVNLEHLSKVIWSSSLDNYKEGDVLYPDTLVGTDSHTTMINALGVLGWGVGGIEAEAAMLGQPISMLVPDVIGVNLKGSLAEGITATDLVLTITNVLRSHGVVGKFVEFFGEGISSLSLADRSTISNMAPEYGATCGFFPIDKETINYLALTGRTGENVEIVEQYAKEQDMWHDSAYAPPIFTKTIDIALNDIEPSIAGPKRPQDKILLSKAKAESLNHVADNSNDVNAESTCVINGKKSSIKNGDIVIAAITSCTNTSNPSVMIAAGLVAKKATELGLATQPWVKTSLAPGSQVVMDYLEKSNLVKPLEDLGFHLVGYGCTTCIGNSGPLNPEIDNAIQNKDLVVASVLSGNRNFEGRIHPRVKLNYLASPPLVVAYALAGSMNKDLLNEPIGRSIQGKDIFLKDIWPTNSEISETLKHSMSSEMFIDRYKEVFKGDKMWDSMESKKSVTYDWEEDSTYVKKPSFFGNKRVDCTKLNIDNAKILCLLGNSVTTDHISPAGSITQDSPAGAYLKDKGVEAKDFNSYGSRRGNHEVMMRGTFANIRIKNEIIPNSIGGITRHFPSEEKMSIYDASVRYQKDSVPLVVIGGSEYGTGSSRDWAAKGTKLLGVKAVITESFERIHRSNLVGMGVLPLVFDGNINKKSLNLKGDETISITGLDNGIPSNKKAELTIETKGGNTRTVPLIIRLDTPAEVEYYLSGGILNYVLNNKISN